MPKKHAKLQSAREAADRKLSTVPDEEDDEEDKN